MEPQLARLRRGVSFAVHPSMYAGSSLANPDDAFLSLETAVQLNLARHYTGAVCARRWLQLCAHPLYGYSRVFETIAELFPKALEAAKCRYPQHEEMTLISLGPGDGRIDLELIQMTRALFRRMAYVCIDTSFELLNHAVHAILCASPAEDDFEIRAIYGDFTKFSDFGTSMHKSGRLNLFSLTGATFGNYDEIELINGISSGMITDDFLFLDAKLHNIEPVDNQRKYSSSERDEILAPYLNDYVKRFVFGPVEVCTLATAEDVAFRWDLNQRISRVPQAINLVVSCEDLDTKLRFTGESIACEHLELAATSFYSFPHLRDWFSSTDFEVEWCSQSKGLALFLLRKR